MPPVVWTPTVQWGGSGVGGWSDHVPASAVVLSANPNYGGFIVDSPLDGDLTSVVIHLYLSRPPESPPGNRNIAIGIVPEAEPANYGVALPWSRGEVDFGIVPLSGLPSGQFGSALRTFSIDPGIVQGIIGSRVAFSLRTQGFPLTVHNLPAIEVRTEQEAAAQIARSFDFEPRVRPHYTLEPLAGPRYDAELVARPVYGLPLTSSGPRYDFEPRVRPRYAGV